MIAKPAQTPREDLSAYVAEMQFHMTLQARNLVPSLKTGDRISSSRDQLLHDTQAQIEKLVSRQSL